MIADGTEDLSAHFSSLLSATTFPHTHGAPFRKRHPRVVFNPRSFIKLSHCNDLLLLATY